MKTQLSLASSVAALAIAAGLATAPASADHTSARWGVGQAPAGHSNQINHSVQQQPFRVFIAVDAGRRDRGRRRGIDNRAEAILFENLTGALPAGVQLVQSRRHADLVIRINERALDVGFRVVDRDRKRRKYKRGRGYGYQNVGGCGIPHQAFYTKVTERGVARYAFDVRIGSPGFGRDRLTLQGATADQFSYGTDLFAATNCGTQPTTVFPNRRVERLFSNNHPQVRRSVARNARRAAYAEAGARLSRIVGNAAHEFFAAQAAAAQQYGGPVYQDGSYQGGPGFRNNPYRQGGDLEDWGDD